MSPVALHIGEGINHWFHATLANRAQFLPLMLTGNIGKPGAGCYTWAGNYKAALFQGSPKTGPGFKGWVAEDPFDPDLDADAPGSEIHAHGYSKDEEPAYWNHSERPLIVETPKYGRKVFTGQTHMPTPTKVQFVTNVNLLNNAKHHYEMIKNVNPNIELIITMDIEMTSTVSMQILPWLRTPGPNSRCTRSPRLARTRSCRSGRRHPAAVRPRDDARILAETAAAIGDEIGDVRFRDYWKFILEGRPEVLYPAPAGLVDDHVGLPLRRHHRRQVWRAWRSAHALSHLSAHPVLGADQRLRSVLYGYRATQQLLRHPGGD